MRKLYVKIFLFAIWALSLTLSNCEKPIPPLPTEPVEEELQTVTFKLNGFNAAIKPLGLMQVNKAPGKITVSPAAAAVTTKNISPGITEQYLYFWSFNNEDLEPDVAIDGDLATISFEATNMEPDFIGGWGLAPIEAGKSFNMKGARSVTLAMPLAGASKVSTFAFDVGSSGTGPKDFKIYYSNDNGNSFIPISENNQFENTKDNGRNSYSFDLSTLGNLDFDKSLIIKIEPAEGERGDAGTFNPTTGTFRMDNVRLSGIYNVPGDGNETPEEISNIHYYIFNAEDNTLAAQGKISFDVQDTQPELTVKLPIGNYYASIFSNASTKELLLPTAVETASALYLSNAFENDRALIFGTKIPSFQVENTVESEVSLKRYFSQINFQFTDKDDLSFIHKIVIKQVHNNFVYSPYGPPAISSIVDESAITLLPSFSQENKSITFNQFMGELAEAAAVSYSVQVYDTDDELLRTFEVTSVIPNNVQLTFTGDLLTGVDKPNSFQIKWNEQWDGELNESF